MRASVGSDSSPFAVVAEDVRMPADELLGGSPRDRAEVARAPFLEQQRQEVDLEQHVAELVQQLRVVAGVRGVRQLVGLLDRVRDDALLVLLTVPGAIAAQAPRDRVQLEEGLAQRLGHRLAARGRRRPAGRHPAGRHPAGRPAGRAALTARNRSGGMPVGARRAPFLGRAAEGERGLWRLRCRPGGHRGRRAEARAARAPPITVSPPAWLPVASVPPVPSSAGGAAPLAPGSGFFWPGTVGGGVVWASSRPLRQSGIT